MVFGVFLPKRHSQKLVSHKIQPCLFGIWRCLNRFTKSVHGTGFVKPVEASLSSIHPKRRLLLFLIFRRFFSPSRPFPFRFARLLYMAKFSSLCLSFRQTIPDKIL